MNGNPKPTDETRGRTELEPGEQTRGEEHTGITIFDRSEPRSVYNLVPREVKEAMDRVHPDVWGWTFKTLEKRARADATLAQLRVSFWHQYTIAQDHFKPNIPMSTVQQGICSKPTFYSYLKDQYKVAYLFYPTADYVASMMEMQDLALREMRKILKMPNAGQKGANMPVIREKIKIFALLENRLRGSVPRRLEHQHSHTLESGPTMKDVTATVGHEAGPKSLKEIDAELRRIDKTVEEKIKEPPPGIDEDGSKGEANGEGQVT